MNTIAPKSEGQDVQSQVLAKVVQAATCLLWRMQSQVTRILVAAKVVQDVKGPGQASLDRVMRETAPTTTSPGECCQSQRARKQIPSRTIQR